MITAKYLTIDETLYPMRNRISFKVYNKSKPTKYGLLFKSLNAVDYAYTYQSHAYASTPVGEHTSHYVNTTDQYVLYLIDKVSQNGAEYSMKGCNVTMDRLYTSITLANKLSSKGITLLGTWQSNRKGFPEEFKESNADIHSSTIWYQIEDDSENVPPEQGNNIRLCSYITKRRSGKTNKIVVMMTTYPVKGVTLDDKAKKPALLKLYDYTKSGTDIMDQRMARRKYSSKAKSNRWTMVGFSYLLDTARINAQTIWSLNNGIDPRQSNSYNFGINVAKALIMPMIVARPMDGINERIRSICYAVTGNDRFLASSNNIPSENLSSSQSTKATRCRQCLADIVGKPEYKTNYKKVPQIKSRCQKCQCNMCRNHIVQLCYGCLRTE